MLSTFGTRGATGRRRKVPRTRTRGTVSVVVPAYRSPDCTRRLLDSLRHQTLRPDRFELIFCLNGPHVDEASIVYADFADEVAFPVRLIRSPVPGTSFALNLGIGAACMPWVTFVDDDDALSPGYLEALVELLEPGVVPIAPVSDFAPDGSPSTASDLGALIRSFAGQVVSAEELARGLSFNAAKVIPTRWAVDLPHEISLTSGHDVAFFARLYARHEFSFGVPAERCDAVYFRTLTPTSVSRRLHDQGFAVDERVAVAARLQEDIDSSAPRKHGVLQRLMRAQASFTRAFLIETPAAAPAAAVTAELAGVGSSWWSTVNDRVPDRLVISPCFVPFNDTSAVTVAKRLRGWEQLADVIALDLGESRRRDSSLERLVQPYVRRVHYVDASLDFSAPLAAAEFVEKGWDYISSELELGDYEELYSRAGWPASHALAAWVKLQRPDLPWVAEFSDPLSRSIEGGPRDGPPPVGATLEQLCNAASLAVREPVPAATLFELCESVAFALADVLLFTNQNQLEYMVSHLPTASLRDQVRSRAKIELHPIPARCLYGDEPLEPRSDSLIRLGYFGSLSANGSVDDVLHALGDADTQISGRFLLDLYSPPDSALEARLTGLDGAQVAVRDPLGYVDFLHRIMEYDVLIVADAHTAATHAVNPYLPSKWSDFAGSGRRVWALVEPRSTLSTLGADYTSVLGDTSSAIETLARIADEIRPASDAAEASRTK